MQANLRKALIILFASACLWQSYQYWYTTRGMENGSEALASWERRFEEAREIIPIKRGVIGYLGEWDIPGTKYDAADQTAEYLLTQYTLAPLILERGANAEWNIAILNSSTFQAWEQEHQGKYQVYRLKNHVYVLQKLGNK